MKEREEERTCDGRTKTGTGSEEEADFRRPATSGPDRQSLFPRSGFLAYTVMHSHPLRKVSRVRFPDLTEQFVSARKKKEESRQSSSLNDSASSRDVSAAFNVETAILGHPVHNQMRGKDGFYAHVFRGPNVVVFHLGENHAECTCKRTITFCLVQNLTHVRVQPTLSFAIVFFRKMTLGFALFLHDTFELFSDHN